MVASSFSAMKILLASGNAKKLNELRSILDAYSLPVQVLSPTDLELNPDDLRDADEKPISIEETGTTFAENALIKAQGFHRACGIPCVSDDSGLSVEALNGEPGVYSARYGGSGLNDSQRNDLLLQKLEAMKEPGQRKAYFSCVLCLVGFPGQKPQYFEGRVDGHIARTPAGEGGFGYDPVFIEESTGQCFAEISPETKASLSHRGQALKSLALFLKKKL